MIVLVTVFANNLLYWISGAIGGPLPK